jgi:DNA mismatch repair protein MutL
MLASPTKISLLPEHLIDQIKAGEVIERPGSLIKEILENSIDAHSTRIELTILNNGLDLISLKDNGEGIFSKDLPLAFSRHATSKISRFEDLYQLGSFGFRGEALASIAAISKIQCLSFNDLETFGSEIRIEGGLTTYENTRQKVTGQKGLELNIQELFYNTPVRLKFIQSQQSEKNYIRRIIYSFVFSHPEVEFSLKINDEDKIIYPARSCLEERLKDIFPKSESFLKLVNRSYELNTVRIYLLPSSLKAPLKIQYTFINKRFVIDKQLVRVVSQTMQTHLGSDDFHYLIFLDLPTDHIDVNVHPNKTIIKIFENSKVISLLNGAIRDITIQTGALKPINSPQNQSLIDHSQIQFMDEEKTLLQKRHEYNMDGIFSPHRINTSDNEFDLLWLNDFFLFKKNNSWFGASPKKLLSIYLSLNLKANKSSSIPLLVSEPFKFLVSDMNRIQSLNEKGIELEKLSADTVVLRSIPEWLNGIPLRFLIEKLIKGQDFESTDFDSRDWSKETWMRMIEQIDIRQLIDEKAILNIYSIMAEKLK